MTDKMIKSLFWTYESFGSDFLPEDADEVIDHANELIEAYAAEHDDLDMVKNYSEKLWDEYCSRPLVWWMAESRGIGDCYDIYNTRLNAADKAAAVEEARGYYNRLSTHDQRCTKYLDVFSCPACWYKGDQPDNIGINYECNIEELVALI